MASTPRIPKAEITGLYGYAVKRFSRKLFGEVPEPAQVLWHHRAVLSSSLGFGRKLQKWDQLDPNLKSFAHMAVAAQVGCSVVPGPQLLPDPQRGPRRGQGERGPPGGGTRPCSHRSSVTSWSTPRR